ncbi:MAG: 2-amino-4-hydroxy-6-hydroxymethyldihydropteridine diphosphokinase [Actinomycetota bacterium]
MKAYVGLGSNLGDRLENLKRAVAEMRACGLDVLAASSVYETDPVGPPQPDFLNAAVEIDCDLPAGGIVPLLKNVEAKIGRGKAERWGPREIDLDLLLLGDQTVSEPGVTVPHPELTNRPFALVPVLELDPDLELPSGEPLEAFCESDPPGVKLFSDPAGIL